MRGPRSATGPWRYGLGAASGAGKVAVSAGGAARARRGGTGRPRCRAALRMPPTGGGAGAAGGCSPVTSPCGPRGCGCRASGTLAFLKSSHSAILFFVGDFSSWIGRYRVCMSMC